MSKTETGKIENVPNARVLQDDELDAVSGGYTFTTVYVDSIQ
jgi:hypothetical protein